MRANSKPQQSDLATFVPDVKIFVGVGVTNYDRVGLGEDEYDKKGQEIKRPRGTQAFHDIPNAGQDCVDMKNLLSKYDFDFVERDREFDKKSQTLSYKKFKIQNDGNQTLFMLNDNCTRKQFDTEMLNLGKILKDKKKKNQ